MKGFDCFMYLDEDVVSELPESAVELASNDLGVQSFSIKNQIFGVQFHPEFTSDITQEYVDIRYKRGIVNNCNQVFSNLPTNIGEWQEMGFLGGTSEEIIDQIQKYKDLQIDHIILEHLDIQNDHSIDNLNENVLIHI